MFLHLEGKESLPFGLGMVKFGGAVTEAREQVQQLMSFLWTKWNSIKQRRKVMAVLLAFWPKTMLPSFPIL